MSSFNRRIFILALATLTGCGFQPAYGPDGPATALQGRIRAADPIDRNGFQLVKRLEDRLGQPTDAAYDLDYTITTNAVSVAVTTEQEITRFNVEGRVSFTVKDAATEKKVTSGSVDSFTSYSATGTVVSTLSAEKDAYARLMTILADQIVTRLVATSAGWAK